MPSANGRGRTLYEILTKSNVKDARPLELQYHNPLKTRVGCTISFEHEPDIAGINFVIEKIAVFETKIRSKKFYHTDYYLKGVSLDHAAPLRFRLRMIPDENVANQIGHRVQLLYLYWQMASTKQFIDDILGDPTGEFWVTNDDTGAPLVEPRKYWRVEEVIDPYNASVTILRDTDGDGTVEESELERLQVTYWDYSRLTDDSSGNEITEFLTVEMDKKDNFLSFLRGTEVLPSQISVF